MNPHAHRHNARVAMWAMIAIAFTVLAVLSAVGWRDNAWRIAAGVLLLGCAAVCVFAGWQARATEREIQRAVARLAAQRDTDRRTDRADDPASGEGTDGR